MNGERKPGVLDRALRLFAEVKAGEGANVVILAVNVFILLTAYSMMKPLRDGLILGEKGPEFTAYMSAAMAFLLIPVIAGYGKLADRFPRRRLINVVTLFFAACCLVFFLAGTGGLQIGIVFFIWIGIFSAMILAQFWGFANDLYTNEEGERLFPIVAVGAAVGAIAGATIVKEMIIPLGLYLPMLFAGALLVMSLFLTNWVDRRERQRTEGAVDPGSSTAFAPAATGEFRMDTGEFKNLREALREALEKEARGETVADEPQRAEPAEPQIEAGRGAFAMVFKTRYLLYIAILILILNWVNTNGENLLRFLITDSAQTAVQSGTAAAATVEQYIGDFYAGFHKWVNIAALVIQLFLVSRIIKHAGIHVAVMILPLIALGSYALIAVYPVLEYVRWAKTAENATDYSLQNTVQNALFLPTTREQKYKAKQVTDSFSKRAGDTLAALTVFVVVTFTGTSIRAFALLNLLLVLIWLAVAYRIGREYRELVRTGRPPV
ncbi:MAG: MFS transporter [Gemmatimonadetes bacterium]|nr:MFS transporter [Gemmatimonadota bacterium]